MTNPTLAYPFYAVSQAAAIIPEIDDVVDHVHLDDVAETAAELIDKAERRGFISERAGALLREVYAIA